MMEHLNTQNVDIEDLYTYIRDNSLDYFTGLLLVKKRTNKYIFNLLIEKMKILYINSNEYEFLSTASLVFSEFKIHSAAPLIVAKLLSGKYDHCGGTFLYCLFSLRKTYVKDELRLLWSRDISWEMKQKLEMMGIFPLDDGKLIY